jgi:hypothetical protein
MNQEDDHHALVRRLRRLAYVWLETLLEPATHAPPANYPFPEGFPFSETPIRATFSWDEFYGGESLRVVSVELAFTRAHTVDPMDPSTRLIWTVTCRTFLVFYGSVR